jgi:hypothetical protein
MFALKLLDQRKSCRAVCLSFLALFQLFSKPRVRLVAQRFTRQPPLAVYLTTKHTKNTKAGTEEPEVGRPGQIGPGETRDFAGGKVDS